MDTGDDPIAIDRGEREGMQLRNFYRNLGAGVGTYLRRSHTESIDRLIHSIDRDSFDSTQLDFLCAGKLDGNCNWVSVLPKTKVNSFRCRLSHNRPTIQIPDSNKKRQQPQQQQQQQQHSINTVSVSHLFIYSFIHPSIHSFNHDAMFCSFQ